NARAKDKEEELHAIADLLQWANEAGLLSPADHERLAAHYSRSSREAAAALTKAITIRDLVLSIFMSIANGRSLPSQRLSELNSALAEVPGLLRVQKHSDRIEREWTSTADGLQQVLFAVLTSAAELLASDRLRRVRECASADCTWLFVDESRNRSRRWCEMRACGNRMKARRHYYKDR
ncbi:MAG TPA: CGNR zinc finger domain-containing protein, partial [Candidatus Acidoferrum sp.]|nr:CGNR zinc finger domain-containing protein [Candidatus Acidoferrum sp.]